ncbi:MAG TPA: aldehyde dehydrogenase family protein [Arthrobacter sp.]|nr:aldehyde dehydrogenase family protein [Arthrobacter sp.]
MALVTGMEAGRNLVLDPHIQAVGFAGSTAAGRILFDIASSRPSPIPFYGELGSLNPLMVTAAAALARTPDIAARLASSISSGAGQLCTKPGLIFIPHGAGGALVAALAKSLRAVPAMTMLNDGIQQRFSQSVEGWTAAEGVSVLVDSGRAGSAGPSLISVDIKGLTGPLLEEAFGPAAVIVRYDTPRQVVATLQSIGGQLTTTLLFEDAERDPRHSTANQRLTDHVLTSMPPRAGHHGHFEDARIPLCHLLEHG